MKNIIINVTGDVQGVNFRSQTQKEALELGLTGFVANQSDGSVRIEAEGEEEDLQALLEWCYTGPDDAKVFKADSTFSDELVGYSGFEIRQ